MARRPERSSKVVTILTSASFSARLSQIAFSSAASLGFSQSKLAADAVPGRESGPAPAASRRMSDIEATVPERPYWRRKEGMNGLLRFMKDCGATVAVEVDTPPFLSDVPRYKLFRIFFKRESSRAC